MKAAYQLPHTHGYQTYGSDGQPQNVRIRERRESRKWPIGYIMLRTGITTQRLEAIERGTVTATDAEVERIDRLLRS